MNIYANSSAYLSIYKTLKRSILSYNFNMHDQREMCIICTKKRRLSQLALCEMQTGFKLGSMCVFPTT